jgi:hypothetical protein
MIMGALLEALVGASTDRKTEASVVRLAAEVLDRRVLLQVDGGRTSTGAAVALVMTLGTGITDGLALMGVGYDIALTGTMTGGLDEYILLRNGGSRTLTCTS